ncbi:MAG: heavy metal sensor histidine kinase [Propionivibrio sp.]
MSPVSAAGRKSIVFRLTLLFATASTVVLLCLGYLIGGAVARHFEELDLDGLREELRLVEHIVGSAPPSSAAAELARQLRQSLAGHHGLAVLVAKTSGERLFVTANVNFPEALINQSSDGGTARPMEWVAANGTPFRGIADRFSAREGDEALIVAAATSISPHEHFMQSFQITLWSFVLLAALVTGLLGWIAARRGLRPLQAIRKKTADITAHRLHTRLELDNVPVELIGLVETFNEMLNRLETSFRQLSEFSSDIAHELRTPVSNLLTQTQVTLSRERTADEYRDVLASNIEEFERLSRMISDMLFLAKADNRLIVPHRERLDLQEEVRGLVEFYEALAEEKSITVSCSGAATVSGDRLMLRRAISNLLSNALRYTPAGEKVAIRIDDGRGDDAAALVKVSVENTGKAIPPEHLPRLFDRFYRVEQLAPARFRRRRPRSGDHPLDHARARRRCVRPLERAEHGVRAGHAG